MNISNIKYHDVANGDGVRTSVFVSGCRRHCKGCFNESAWDFNAGKPYRALGIFDEGVITFFDIADSVNDDSCDGISILGGEPFEEENIKGVLDIVLNFRRLYADKKTIWMWTGYRLEEIVDRNVFTKFILMNIDYLVDGEYIEELRLPPGKEFRGSSNQRIINMKEYWEKCDKK